MDGESGPSASPRDHPDLIGQARTLAHLSDLLSSGDRTAVILGDAGAGKSAWLDHLSDQAAGLGFTTLRVCGHAEENGLPFATLVDLLSRAVPDSTADSADVSRILQTLVPELADDLWEPPDPLRLRLDVLGNIERMSRSAPVLLVVDDAHWVDPSSGAVLAFLARRLGGMRVSMLVAARGDTAPEGFQGHSLATIPPLDELQAAQLLRARNVPVDASGRAEVIAAADGNPLALIELARARVAGGSRAGLISTTGVPNTVESVFAAQIAELTAPSRRLLLLAAAGADLPTLGRIVGQDNLVADLEPPELAGLVRVVDGSLTFRHPLARSAAYSFASLSQRISAHTELAVAYSGDVDRRAWHRAVATVVPDEEIAAELMRAGVGAGKRGAHVEAVRTMVRAAELTPNRDQRALRLLESLEMSTHIGHLDWMLELADRVRTESNDPTVRALASCHVAYGMAKTTRQHSARVALDEALRQLVPLKMDLGWGSLTTLARLAYESGDDRLGVAAWLDLYRREAPPMPEFAPVIEAAQAWIRTAIDPLQTPEQLVDLVRNAPALVDQPAEAVANREMLLGATAWLLDEPESALLRLGRSLEVMRRTNAPERRMQTLTALAQVQIDVGAYHDAERSGRMLIDLGAAQNLELTADLGRDVCARVAALRGDANSARQLTDEILHGLDLGEWPSIEGHVRLARSHAHFALDEPEAAFEELYGLYDSAANPSHPHVAYRALGELVAASVRAGRIDDAAPIVRVAEQRLPQGMRRKRHELILARCHALLMGDEADGYFTRTISDPMARQWPFDLANCQLEYGGWLRRRRRPTEARHHLQMALDTFTRLGTTPWVALTERELRATGVRTPRRNARTGEELTSQEQQVVRLAAAGMTNREIAAHMSLSPRTISAHLYRAFPKLGVTQRSQLRDVVSDD